MDRAAFLLGPLPGSSVAGQGGDHGDLARGQEFRQPRKAVLFKDREVAAVDDFAARLASGLDEPPKVIAQFRCAAGDVHGLRFIFGNPITNAIGRWLIKHLGAPRCGVHMAVSAGLVAFAADIELQRDK